MRTQNKFWWFVAVAAAAIMAVLCTISILFWQQLPQEQRLLLVAVFKDNFAYVFTVVVLLFTAFGFTIDWFFRFYIIPVNQLAEAVDLISTVNPLLQIKIDGSYDVVRLADIINSHLKQRTEYKQIFEEKLSSVKADTENEKNILATLLEDLPQGILVCNAKSDIVFYNKKIKALLSPGSNTEGNGDTFKDHWFGLGRSVFLFLDKTLISRSLERIEAKLKQDKGLVGERFLIGCPATTSMLPAEMKPVLDRHHHIAGYIIFVDDKTLQRRRDKQIQEKVLAWRYKITQSVSVIKATADLLKDSANPVDQGRNELIGVLAKEANLAADLMKNWSDLYPSKAKQPWPLTPIDAAEWGRLLQRRTRELSEISLNLDIAEPMPRLSVDLHHLTIAIAFVLQALNTKFGLNHIQGRMYCEKSWIYLKFTCHGGHVDDAQIETLKHQKPVVHDSALNNTFSEILEFHGGGMWIGGSHKEGAKTVILFYLPIAEGEEPADANGHMTIPGDSRPEFYDFNLFRQSGQSANVIKRPLRELIYTVLDTETTGLDPQGGDEIISISAVRIVNGRLLNEERFSQLVNPCRPLPWESVKYHGIRQEMLENQPVIEEVLPKFHAYVRGSTLVGHNVAFDMRMLQMKEERAGLRFDNPVLDTLLLSAFIHPAQKQHTLEAVADRFGVKIVGRHTALGDATATGQIFLKMLPILSERGIFTLEQAINASEKTYYARLKY